MKTVKIQIPDMQSSHCQMRVNNALKSLDGVTIDQITAGEAEISIQDDARRQEAIAAIEKAGYTVAAVQTAETQALEDEGPTFTFKTNIHCSGCVASVGKALDAANGICHWTVDTANADKILTVHSEGITEEEVIGIVRQAGYQIESIHS